MKESERIVNFCRALSVETRAGIIELLRDGPLCVGALAHRLGVSQGAVSQHLRILKDAELVRPVRKGLFLHYEINKEVFSTRLAQMKNLISIKTGGKKHACIKKGVINN